MGDFFLTLSPMGCKGFRVKRLTGCPDPIPNSPPARSLEPALSHFLSMNTQPAEPIESSSNDCALAEPKEGERHAGLSASHT